MTKEEKILLKTFFKFLKENDALEQYKVNTINGVLYQTKQIGNALMPFKAIKDKFHRLCSEKTNYKTFYKNIISFSFAWANTQQGYYYWSRLNSQWTETIKMLYKDRQ